MTAEEYRKAGELFARAVVLAPDKRAEYLDSQCGKEADLRQHVEALLQADGGAPQAFMAQPALLLAANLAAEKAMREIPGPGTRLGAYLLGAQIASGGMGTVYEALDTRLDRKVAIKILPSIFVSDRDRVQRFRQEARAASQLNHPNILSIYDAELYQGHYYIATELVSGKTLRQVCAEGRPEERLVLEVGAQICAALDAAHRAGIVHRDIKPENVMLRPDGIVKVLDFGLAKLLEPAGSETDHLKTRAGDVAGTLPYLSPEQVLGKPATPQSDIFSLGVLLYELATGVRPFAGPTEGVIFSAILNHVPAPPSSLRFSLDSDFDAIIMRALEKDPEMRFQTAADLRSAFRFGLRGLRQGSRDSQAATVVPLPKKRQRPAATLLAGALIGGAMLSAGGFLLWFRERAAAPPLPDRFTRLTDLRGEEIFPSLSPDGKQFIYASTARGKWDIYLQRVGGNVPVNLTRDSNSDDREPALSNDGSRVAFRSERNGGGLFVMEATGENPVRVTDNGYLPSWSPDGKSIIYADVDFSFPSNRSKWSHLWVVNLATGTHSVLPISERGLKDFAPDAIQPRWSPHGYRIAYWGLSANGARDISTVPASGGESTPVTLDTPLDWNPVWSPSGDYLYFLSDRGGPMNLWRIAIDERSGRVKGKPEPVTTPADYVMFPNFSADGGKFVYSATARRVSLFSIPFRAQTRETIGKPAPAGDAEHNVTMFDFSPDGSQIVYDTIGAANEDIWIQNVDGSGRRRLVEGGKNHGPAWSPTGNEIAFFSSRQGPYQEFVIHPDGSGLRPLTAFAGPNFLGMQAPAWIDSTHLIAGKPPLGPVVLDIRSSTPVASVPRLPGFDQPDLPVILWPPIAGVATGYTLDGSERIFLYSLKEGKRTILPVRGVKPVMVPGLGNLIVVYIRGSGCYLYDTDLKREKRLFSTAPDQIYCVRPSRDGKQIFFSVTIREADVWMAQMQQ